MALGNGLGMNTVAWTLNPSDERARAYGTTFVSLDELVARADVISLQLPLSEETEGLIGARELAMMKPTAILVNVGRGAVVDEDALIAAGHPLTTLENGALAPHTAANTPQANRAGLELAIRNIVDWQRGTLTNSLV